MECQRRTWIGGCLGAGPYHLGLQRFVRDLNQLYSAESGFWQGDYALEGFHWVDCNDREHSVLSFVRQNPEQTSELVVILNLTPVPRYRYRVGLPRAGRWREKLNSDAAIYGGSNLGNLGVVRSEAQGWQNQPCSAEFTLPPLSAIVFSPES